MYNNVKNKILIKAIATILLFVMVFQFMPNIVIAVNEMTDNNESVKNLEEHIRKTQEEIETQEPVIIGEIEEQRTLNEKHFLMSDGTIVASVFPSNIHYEKDGKLLDADNTLEEVTDTKESLRKKDTDVLQEEKMELNSNLDTTKEFNTENMNKNNLDTRLPEEIKKETKVYKNKTGNAKINFTNKTSGFNLGTIESDGYTITWGLLNSKASNVNVKDSQQKENKTKGKKADEIEINIPQTTIEYADILSNTNVEYSIEPEHVKENIVLKNKGAINNELKFVYDVGSLEMKLLESKDIIVYNQTEDNIVFTIEAPFMYDGKLEFSNDIDIKLEKQNDRYIVTLIPNREWLKEKERVYPVTIDPSITTSRYYQDIQDTFIYSTQGSSQKGDAHIFRAGNGWGNSTRSLIKFNLPELNAGDQVIGAYLSIFSYPKTTEWTPPTRQIQLDVHKMTSDWNESTAVWSNTNTNYAPRIEDYIIYQFDYDNQCKQYNFDITSIAKEWYTTGNNYGVMIKEHVEANNVSGNEAYFISADTTSAWYEGRPVVQIIYRNQTGLEDYLSYHVQDLGRAGAVYTNDYNGNLTWVHEDLTTPGEKMPVTIKHVYNTNDKDIASRFGNGIRLNISQTIELVTIGGTDYAEYTDEDGTKHYFTKESANTYKDEDGLGLELTLDTNSVMFIMKDKGDNILRFERRYVAGRYLWHLKEIEDNNGNKTVISFLDTISDQFIITKITDAAGQEITFQYSGYYLWKINGSDGKSIEYTYGSTGILDNIKYPDGLRTYYDFSGNVLNAVQKLDGTLVKYQYYNDKTKRVKKISECANDAVTVGNSMDITYSNNLTTFTDNQGYSNNVTFNDWGQAISVADFGKGVQDFKEAYGKVYNYGTSGGSKNKLTLDGKLTKSVNNLVFNGSAEYDGEWSIKNWNMHPGTGQYATDDKYTGNRSLKFTSTYDESIHTISEQAVTVSKGKTYTLSVQAKNVNIGNGQGGGYMQMYYKNASGTISYERYMINKDLNGWEKHSLTIEYPSDAIGPLYVLVGLINNTGTIYFDNIQLEEGSIANEYNMIENATFDYSGDTDKSWTTLNAISGVDTVTTLSEGTNAFKITGDITKSKYVRQDVITTGKAGDTFSVSGWVYAGGTRNKGETVTLLTVNVVGNNDEQQWTLIHNDPSDQWQFVQREFIANHDYKRIEVYFCFYKNVNEAYVTNVSLYKDNFGQSYQYDSNGNLIKSQDLAKQQNTFNYDGNDNLIKSINPKGGTFEYQYDTTYKHRLTKAISSTGVNYNFEYNQYGEAINSKITNNTDSKYIETTAEYSANGNYLTKLTDEKGNATNYEYNQTTGTLTKVTNSNNEETNYTYDNLNRISTVNKTANGQNYQNSYTYTNDRLNTITHNGFNYSFIYDKFGNISQVKVGTQNLITNNYAANNGNLTSAIYGNNQQIAYSYDRFNRMATQSKAQGTYQYEYDAKSNLAYVQSPEGIKTYYTYDLADRLVKVNNTTYNFARSYTYDQNNNINSKKYKLGNITNETNYTFDKDNRITNVNLNTNANIVTNYDTLSRIVNKQLKVGANTYTTQYNYENLENSKTTTSISSITNGTNNISYTYDNLGNIQTITEGSILKATYHYDELNQLIREDNSDLNKTITYTYDLGGNITTKTEYPYTTGTLGTATNTINYSYTNTNWKDQLTSYNGQAITYDAIGNPITYNGSTYTWQNGRELAQIVNGTNTYQYKYNDEGIRIEKNVNGTVTKYYTEGTKVIYEKTGNNTIYYSYDETESIVGINYNGTEYWYIKNLQGDIIGILDNNLTQVVSYTYDSWGKIISIKDTNGNEITDTTNIGLINPYRYRSYRYDAETELYYLNSRYYNPEWGRFINGDGYGGQVGELLSHNIYSYCGNNPINRHDPTGLFWRELLEVTLQTIQSWSPAYAGARSLAMVDGPLPFGDVVGTIGTIGITAGAVGSSIYKVATKPKTISIPKEKADTTLKVPRGSQYWEANNNAIPGTPLTYPQAVARVKAGGNVICIDQIRAFAVAKWFPESYLEGSHGGDGYYPHYHISKKHGNPHIWFYDNP